MIYFLSGGEVCENNLFRILECNTPCKVVGKTAILCMEPLDICNELSSSLPVDFAPYFKFDKELSRMKYIKANTIFPQNLLDEIQKYVQGELVYIPKSPANHDKWGANTETKKVIEIRNQNIMQAFTVGTSITELAELYYLSEGTIKKIVYSRKN